MRRTIGGLRLSELAAALSSTGPSIGRVLVVDDLRAEQRADLARAMGEFEEPAPYPADVGPAPTPPWEPAPNRAQRRAEGKRGRRLIFGARGTSKSQKSGR